MDLSLDLKQLTVDEGRSKELQTDQENTRGRMPVGQIPNELLTKARETVEAKRLGSLVCSIRAPSASYPRVSAHIHMHGSESVPRPAQSTECPDRGLGKTEHPSFELYRIQKRFTKRQSEEELDEEGCILFDPEAYPAYESVGAGNVTVEGFGLDFWDAEIKYKRVEPQPCVSLLEPPDYPFVRVAALRRIEELRSQSHLASDEDDEMTKWLDSLSQEAWSNTADCPSDHEERVLTMLCAYLHRADFSGLTTTSPGATPPSERYYDKGWLQYIYLIMARQLALRLQNNGSAFVRGLTKQVLAAFLLSDCWFENTKIELVDDWKIKADVAETLKTQISQYQREDAEELMCQGDRAAENGRVRVARSLYTQAIRIDLSNYEFIRKRAELMLMCGHYRGAVKEGMFLKILDPTRVGGYMILGRGYMGSKNYQRAQEAFSQASQLVNEEERGAILEEIGKAEAASTAQMRKIDEETDEKQKRALVQAKEDIKWKTPGQTIRLLPSKYERQLEGLLLFAERIKWPYNKVREGLEKAYKDWLTNEPTWFAQQDWILGVMLPGASFAHALMSTLICSTPFLNEEIDSAQIHESGLLLVDCSYWRVRSAVGRVLGCLPGVISLNGWVGPCRYVQIDDYPEYLSVPRHCLVTASPLGLDALLKPPPPHIEISPLLEAQRVDAIHEVIDTNQWVTLKPPEKEETPWKIDCLSVERGGRTDPSNRNSEWFYRASIDFRITDGFHNLQNIYFYLKYNSVFVTLPPCLLDEPKETHEVHRRELHRYNREEVSAKVLNRQQPFADDDKILVINATGPGSEVVARAWCAHHGKAAVVRKDGGPCYVCALQAASRYGLRTGVLIWVS